MLHSRVFEARIPLRKFAAALFLVSNSIVWYILTNSVLTDDLDKLSLGQNGFFLALGMYYAGIALAAILGTVLFRRSRVRWLSLWMLLGAAMTALLPVLLRTNLWIDFSVSLVFGISTGVGLPSCLAYFADATSVENRGTYGGITWGAIGLSVLVLVLVTRNLAAAQSFGALALWRLIGFMVFFPLSRGEGKVDSAAHVPSYRSILGRRDIMLYLLPWILFSLVNFIEAPILKNSFGDNAAQLAAFVEVAISGVSAVVGGFLADIVGRKRIAMIGFILLGLEYAFLSLFSTKQGTWYVYTLFDGIAWGFFAAVFFMTLWGDLAQDNQKEKYYLLGGLPYLLAGYLSELMTPFAGSIQTSAAFSLASFFLFLAMLPLMYAPETLSEKRMREMELKNYVEKAKKVKEKYA
jgi:MFS family permease